MQRANTDSALCLQAEEFQWQEEGLTDAHGYILPTLARWLATARIKTVFDLGCGNGALTHALAGRGFQMTGLDNSLSGLAIAARHYRESEFIRADLETPLPETLHHSFDAVIAVEVIEHLLLPRNLFRRAREALRPGGRLIVTTPYHGLLKNLALALSNKFDDHWHPLRDYGHVKFFSKKTLTRLFAEQNFEVQRISRVGRIPALAKSMIVQGSMLP